MTGTTHIIGGVLTGLIYASAVPEANPMLLAGASAVGSLIPDIDICTSKLGRKILPASFLIQLFIGHRTLFHAPLLYAGLWLLLSNSFPQFQTIITALTIGIASHLFLDCLNPAGIPILYPIHKRFHLMRIHTRGLTEKVLALGMVMFLGYYIFANIQGGHF